MSLKIALANGYLVATMLGFFCPMQMAAVLHAGAPMQEHGMDGAMMSSAATMSSTMSLATASVDAPADVPATEGGCSGGHCFAATKNGQEDIAGAVLAIEAQETASLPPVDQPVPVRFSSVPEPPGNFATAHLAAIIATVVLTV